MATKERCEAALRNLAARLDGLDPHTRRKHAPDRSITCRFPDLGTSFSGWLHEGALRDIAEGGLPNAQIKLTMTSDDLLAVTEGRLAFPTAWATGRLKIEASLLDLLRLRSLF